METLIPMHVHNTYVASPILNSNATRLSNAPAIFNRCLRNTLRSVREFVPGYFDDVFVYSRSMDGQKDVEVHRLHVRNVLTLMHEHKLCANLKK